MTSRPLTIVAAAAACLSVTLTALVVLASPAAAEVGDVTADSCVALPGLALAECAADPLLSGAATVAVSPDGRHAYVPSWNSNAVTLFDRDAVSGALTRRPGADACYRETPVEGDCVDTVGMGKPIDVLVSPDGAHVYVLGWASSSVAVFDRDPATGKLTQRPGAAGCIANGGLGGACTAGRALTLGLRLIPSPDFEQIYVTGQANGGSLAVLNVRADGSLLQGPGTDGCVTNNGAEGCTQGFAMSIGYDAVVSPDGRHLYLPSSNRNGLVIFNRDTATGVLTQKNGKDGCITDNGFPDGGGAAQCLTAPGLRSPWSLVMAPDGEHVYATSSSHSGSLVVLDRSSVTGLLTQSSCLREDGAGGCADARLVSSVQGAALSPDGDALVLRNMLPDGRGGLSFFDVDSSGALTQRPGLTGCLTRDGAGTDNSLALVAGQCAVSPALRGGEGDVSFLDDRVLHYASFNGTLATLQRDQAPVCSPATVVVPHATDRRLDLSCTDPNGDPVTLSITQPPLAGQLGGVDQAASRVIYSPFDRFIGTDRFYFQGSADGVDSVPAKVTLRVVPTVKISDSKVVEGHSGTQRAVFAIKLSGASKRKVTVRFSTVAGSAKSPADFKARSGTVTFRPGQTVKKVAVTVQGDRRRERRETFQVSLSEPTKAVFRDSSGKGTIVDDD